MADAESFLFKFLGDEDDLIHALREVEAHLKEATGKKYNFEVEGTGFQEANREIDLLEAHLKDLSAESADPEVHMIIRDALKDMALIRAGLAQIPDKKEINVEVKNKGLAAVNRMLASSEHLGDNFRKLEILGKGGKLTPDPTKWDQFAGGLARVALQLRRLPSFIGGVSIALVASMIPALLAATAAIAGMTVAAAGLGSALIAGLIPAVGVAAAVINRLTKVFAVRQGLEQAKKSQAAQAAAATDAEAQADRQLEDASRAVADAQRAQQQASKDLQAAQAALADAAVQAFREMEDAAEQASDAVLDLADAKLSLEEASLGVDEAKNALAQFREEIGATGDEFSGMFQKFTNVDAPFDKSKLAGILEAGKVSKDDQLELESLILRVRRAKLQEKQATDGVSDAERNLKRAREENNKFLREGIAASGTYQAAVARVQAAEESLAQATRGVTDARRNQARAAEDAKKGVGGLTSALAAARAEFKKLSPQEKAFVRAMERVDGLIERVKRRIAGQIFATFTSGLRALPALLKKVEGPLVLLAGAFARLGKQFAKHITKRIAADFGSLVLASLSLAASFTQIFTGLFDIIMNLGRAAMPFLLKGVKDIADAFTGWAKGTKNTNDLRDALRPGVKLIRIAVAIIGDLGSAIFGAFQGGKGPIQDFFKFIRKATKGLSDFFKSDEGKKEVSDFFKDTLPFVKALLKFIGKLVKIFIVLLKIILPIAKPIIESFSFLADVSLVLLNVLNNLLGPFKGIIGEIAALFIGTGAVTKGFRALGFVFLHFGAILGRAGKFFKVFFKESIESFQLFIKGIRAFGGLVVKAFRIVIGLIGRVWSRVGPVLTAPIRLAMRLIKGILERYIDILTGVVKLIVKGFKSAWGGIKAVVEFVLDRFRRLRDVGVKIFQGLVDGIKSAFVGVKSAVKFILNGLITVANKFIKAFNAVFGHERKINLGFKKITLPSLKIDEIPKLASGGVVNQDTLFRAGEGSGSEAVIPLSRSVLKKLGESIIGALGSGPMLAAASPGVSGPSIRREATPTHSGDSGTTIHHQEVHLPAPPSGGAMDPRYAAVQFAREMKRRGL